MEITDNRHIQIPCQTCKYCDGIEALSLPDSTENIIDLFVKCSKIQGGSMNAKKMLSGCPVNEYQSKDYENG